MTARQQIARLLPLGLLVLLVIAGLRGTVPAPGWNGPLRSYGTAIGIGLEVLCGALLIVIRVRATAARRAAERRPFTGEQDIEPADALRYTLRYVLGLSMIAIAVVLITNLHLHFFTARGNLHPPQLPKLKAPRGSGGPLGGGHTFNIPLGPILYGLLVLALVAAVAISIWWSTRLRRPAVPLVIEDVSAEELREAVAEGRAALAGIDDARAAIIACYVAMERSLGERGTARAAADTPDELLARAVAAGVVRGGAAGRLTALFYEARFSTHPLGSGQRDAASAALDELAAELAARPGEARQQEGAGQATTGQATTGQGSTGQASTGQDSSGQAPRPGGGWV